MHALSCRRRVHALYSAILAFVGFRPVARSQARGISGRTSPLSVAVVERVVICKRWIVFVVIALPWAFAATAPAAATLPPEHDAFSAAATIQGGEGQSETTNAGATKEAGEPAHAGQTGGASVWFRWTAPHDGSIAFDTAPSPFDTVLAVYTGSAPSALDRVAADDDSGPDLRSEVSFRAIAGTVYHVAVDGFHGKVGRVHLAWRSAPPNDNFAEARTLGGPAGTTAISGVGATGEAGEPGHSGGSEADQSVWFRWTAPAAMRVGLIVPTGGSIFVYTGASFNTLARAAEGSPVAFDANAGTTYQIAIEGAGEDAVFSWRTLQPNDDFADAATIVGGSGRTRGSTFPATRETGEPEHGGSAGSVWYQWRAPRTGFLRLRTTDNTSGQVLAVYRGSRLSALRPLASSGEVVVEVQRQRAYRIAVLGTGDFVLHWGFRRDAQPNDDFAEAATIVGRSGRIRGSTFPSTRQTGEPPLTATGSVWYRWRAPRAGILRLRTTDITFDTVLAVYRGSRLPELRILAANDDSGEDFASEVRIEVQRRRVYRIAVTGFGSGDFVLRWSLSPDSASGER